MLLTMKTPTQRLNQIEKKAQSIEDQVAKVEMSFEKYELQALKIRQQMSRLSKHLGAAH